jgi:hypothetical protein
MRPEQVRFGRRVFLALTGLCLFLPLLPKGPATVRAAGRTRSDAQKGEVFSGNLATCATCDMWDGPREIDALKNQATVVGGEETEGHCLRYRYGFPGRENLYTMAGDVCQWYRRANDLI